MNPALTLSFPSSSFNNCAFHPFSKPQFLPLPNAPFRTTPGYNPPLRKFAVWSSSSSSSSSSSAAADSVPCFDVPVPTQNPLLQKIKAFAKSSILIAATVSFVIRVNKTSVARAEVSSPPPTVVTEELPADVGGKGAAATLDARQDGDSVLHEFLESNPESLDYLKKLLQQQLEAGEDREALTLLEQIVSAHPGLAEYKILLARLYNELGETVNARRVFDDILADNPLSFEALFENSLLMDRCGEGETVISRLEEAVKIAEDEGKKKEARDVRLIIAQMEFLRKDVEGALRSYEELIKDDVSDFRPYFCKGMIFSLVGKDDEAKEMFKKYKELSPRKFDVEGYIRSPLSRVKVFGTNETN